MNKYMQTLKDEIVNNRNKEYGSPFVAMVVKGNEIISIAKNETYKEFDMTAHAEMLAIREACRKLETKNLQGCTIYTSVEPCGMCYNAIKLAKIDKIYFACYEKDYFKAENKKEAKEVEKEIMDRESMLEILK